MDKEYKKQQLQLVGMFVMILVAVAILIAAHVWNGHIVFGSAAEREAILAATVWSLSKEGIEPSMIESIDIEHAAGLSAPQDPNRRYQVEVSIIGEDMYRRYRWVSGTATEKEAGVDHEFSRYK